MSIKKLNLPIPIVEELKLWKKHCDIIKNSPLSYLKSHDNVGTKTNNYQTSVPVHLIESSYWLPFTLRSCAQFYGGSHRDYYLRKHDGHFDGYDIWINYSYKGNSNPAHAHAGNISGVIYLENEDNTIFPNLDFKFKGKQGDMILFSSDTLHMVDPQEKEYERITFAFNINIQKLS
jgi:hypothetical protein|tara:strand:+ start:214 stop:741 length:528 start_codon:yes stop_codon:yes gene_type:complete